MRHTRRDVALVGDLCPHLPSTVVQIVIKMNLETFDSDLVGTQ